MAEAIPPEPAAEAAAEDTTDDKDASSSSNTDWSLVFSEALAFARELWLRHRLPAAGGLVAALVVAPGAVARWLVAPILNALWTTLAVGMGVGVGLGLATYVYDWLQANNNNTSNIANTANANHSARGAHPPPLLPGRSGSSLAVVSGGISPRGLSMLDDEQTYPSVMKAAGYDPLDVRRGQVVRRAAASSSESDNNNDNDDSSRAYRFDASAPRRRLRELWPTLPEVVADALGLLTDRVVRDFVGGWYGLMDPSVQVPTQSTKSKAADPRSRRWLDVTGPYQKQPFLEHVYSTFAICFGNLATRVEHVNILEVVLLHWVRVLSHTFQWYRHLRKAVQRKNHGNSTTANNNSSGGVTEMMMTREFLLTNKLHKAVVFGLDVPALLFADAEGRDCPPPGCTGNTNPPPGVSRADWILEQRLFGSSSNHDDDNNQTLDPEKSDDDAATDETSAPPKATTRMLEECELDYHRSVAHRMTRALLPRHEFESTLVSSLVTEIIAGSVLTPLMGCFTPDYINGWLVQGLTPSEKTDDGNATTATGTGEQQRQQHVDDEEPSEDPSTERDETVATVDVIETLAPVRAVTPPPLNPTPTASAAPSMESGEDLVTQLAQALIDLQQFVDFDDLKEGPSGTVAMAEGSEPDWDDPSCQAAVIRLVLVVEAALQNGRCTYRIDESDIDLDREDTMDDEENDDIVELDDSDRPVEVTLNDFESTTLSQLLMELTSDLDAFEQRVAGQKNTMNSSGDSAVVTNDGEAVKYKDEQAQMYVPTQTEHSTLRTLIAAWLHTGHIFRTITVLCQAHATVLAPYYHSAAFLRGPHASSFCRQLRALERVHILVDTMTVLASPRLEEAKDLKHLVQRRQTSPAAAAATNVSTDAAVSPIAAVYSSATPRHFDFHRNEAFASSLRSERERRAQSWVTMMAAQDKNVESSLPIVCCQRLGAEHVGWHRELHHVAKVFYSGTNLISLRDAARKAEESTVPVSLLTVEMASARRRIEVPDDDSSFLLRAQPRPLNAVGVHRDSRNHDLSFKCFAATFEDPVGSPDSGVAGQGGRHIRRCLIRYFPIDRTATVSLQNDARKLDMRKTKGTVPDTITLGQSPRSAPILSADFLRERHLCQRWAPKGTNRTQSLLASSVMESTDFTSMPRSGRAIDFLYRMSFFERPMIDLGGKHFTVHDSGTMGTHRADASCLEMSDAALSATLLAIGAEVGSTTADETAAGTGPLRQEVEMGKDGYPIVWMKFNRKQDESQVEVKPYRVSFVRAALLLTAARAEAQIQSLTKCVQAGSAKKATRALTDAHLRPALRLLEFAGNNSREKQSLLLRDLKLGVNHIDRTQLRRNGLLLPRYPTRLLDLTANIETAMDASQVRSVELFGTTGIVYKIHLSAKVDLIVDECELDGADGYRSADGTIGRVFREEWVVYRSFKEFHAIHKHLKNQVSASESSGTAGSRLVGAASAAFTAHSSSLNARARTRKVLIPSMSQAAKIGALGITKKSVEKRKDSLNEYLQYILSPGHLLSRCPELMLFLGAFYPLLPHVAIGQVVSGIPDPLGRTEMTRTVLESVADKATLEMTQNGNTATPSTTKGRVRADSQASIEADTGADDMGIDSPHKRNSKDIEMIPSIRNKIDKVPLALVRNRMFELLRYQFGFENASFARNRMLAAIKTASFAVTSASEFRRTLYKLHRSHVSADAIAGWINFTTELLWPHGVFFESSPPLTRDELRKQSEASREALHASFPEAVRAILGQELTHDGLELCHEMLQNRLVVKSMAYMLFDLLLLEIFPEIGDILQCGAALDIDT